MIQLHAGTFHPSLFLQLHDYHYELPQKSTEILNYFCMLSLDNQKLQSTSISIK